MLRAVALALASTALLGAAGPPGAWRPAAKTPQGLVAPGYTLLGSAQGDLDGDGRPDAVLALARADEREHDEGPRWLLVARRDPDGLLRPWTWSAHAIFCRGCGGVFGDPFAGVSIDHGAVVVNHYGGSNWRWAYTDRFMRWRAAWRHIGTTSRETFTPDPGYLHERDENLLTGYTIVTRHGMGQAGTQRYHEVLAPRVAAPPPGDYPGLPTRLVTREDVIEHAKTWWGTEDLSARISAVTVGDRLYLMAMVTDDHPTPGDAVRLVDEAGQVVTPLATRRVPLPYGYRVWATYPLARLGLARARHDAGTGEDGHAAPDPILRASVEVVDDDGPGRSRKVMSTSQGGRAYPGAIRLSARAEAESLAAFDRWIDAGAGDRRLDKLPF